MSVFRKKIERSPIEVTATPDPSWRSLNTAGGAAALIAVVLVIIEMVGFAATGTLPNTVAGWFELLQDNRLLGLIDLYVLEIVAWALFIPVFLALYRALKPVNESYMAIATAMAFIGIADYIATNAAFNMLNLSDQFAAATTDAQRSLLLSAGQAVLAAGPAAGFNMGLLLVSAAGLIVSVVMLRSETFGKVTAYVGILANAVGLTYYLALAVPSIGAILLGLSGLLFLIWILLVGVKLHQSGRRNAN